MNVHIIFNSGHCQNESLKVQYRMNLTKNLFNQIFLVIIVYETGTLW